jgi:hypothetical protein
VGWALFTNKSIRVLNLSNNALTPRAIYVMVMALRYNQVMILTMTVMVVTRVVMMMVCGDLSEQHSGLRSLDISGNNIGHTGARQLMGLLLDMTGKIDINLMCVTRGTQ